MDPAITAALINTPTAVIAAAAAYAAGRAQARGAHRGSVDAVRRQHQRDAYAELIRAAWSYHQSTWQVLSLVERVHGAELSLGDFDGDVRTRLLSRLNRPNLRRRDLADALAPTAIPSAIDRALARLEEESPNWQQDIHDANQIDALLHAEVVVTLEGPDHLAELAKQLFRQALFVQRYWGRASSSPFLPPWRERERGVSPFEAQSRLREAIDEFTQAARAHLNTIA